MKVLSLLVMVAFASTNEWKKVELERKTEQRFTSVLRTVIDTDRFFVEAKISYRPPEKEAEDDTTEKKVGKFSITSMNLDEKRDDMVPLRTLDLYAPPIGHEFEDEKVKKAAKVEDEFSIIKNITSIDVVIVMDQNISTEEENAIDGILSTVGNNIFGVRPNIEKKKMLLRIKKKKEIDPLDLAIKISSALGILLAAILIGFFAILKGRKDQKLKEKELSLMEEQVARTAPPASAAAAAGPVPAASAAAPGASAGGAAGGSGGGGAYGGDEETVELLPETDSMKGFEKFRELILIAPEESSQMVRRWLKTKGLGPREALIFLVRQSTSEELETLLTQLTIEERKEWRELLKENIDDPAKAIFLGSNFIEKQIVDNFLVPPPNLSEKAKDLIAGITTEECIVIAQENPKIGAILMNILPSSMATKMYHSLDVEIMKPLFRHGLKFTEDILDNVMEDLENILEKKVNARTFKEVSPFMERLGDLLVKSGREKERMLLHGLMDENENEVLQRLSTKFFPSELIFRLNSDTMREILLRMTIRERAHLFFSVMEEEKEIFLESLGEEGSKIRRAVEIEMEEMTDQEKQVVERERDRIWMGFRDLARGIINNNKEVGILAKKILEQWWQEQKTVSLEKAS